MKSNLSGPLTEQTLANAQYVPAIDAGEWGTYFRDTYAGDRWTIRSDHLEDLKIQRNSGANGD